jgi:hypothetical protein
MVSLFLVIGSAACLGQSTNSGDLRGTVTDSSGAVVPGATVTVLNIDTGVSKDYSTNQDGLYDTSSVVEGNYRLTFKKEGFGEFVRGPITVQVGFTTVNAELRVGQTQTVVTVTTDVPLLQQDSGDQSTVIPAKELDALPQTGESWENFAIQINGSAGAPGSSQGSSNPGQEVAVNGNLPYSNILLDGSSTTAPSSMNATSINSEVVQELQVTTSSFSAQYGIGGIIFNQITKGGGSRFHGAGYEFFQNNIMNAAPYGFGNTSTVPVSRYNNFGGSIGGPIALPVLGLKKKAFFFFNYDRIINHGAASQQTVTIPTTAVMGGDFTGQPTIYDPTTQTMGTDSLGNPYPIRKSFISEYGSNMIPTTAFDSVAAAVQQYFPTPSSGPSYGKFVAGTLNSRGVLLNNYYTSLPSISPTIRYFGRADYDITPNNRLSMSDAQQDSPGFGYSSDSACPIGCQNQDGDSNLAQVTDVWNINPRTINEARLGYSFYGSYYTDPALGKGYAAKVGWQFAKADDLPIINFSNNTDATLGPATNSAFIQHVFDPSDVVTMILGKHILHFGGEVLIYRDDSTAWGNSNPGTMQFSGQYTQNWTLSNANCPAGTPSVDTCAAPDTSTGVEYADFLLGQAQSWNANVSPEFGARLKSPQTFIQDDYKIRPKFTVNLGLRYQINHGWNEVHGNLTSFDPTVTNPATGTLGAMWYASTHANGRTALMKNIYNDFMPRVGFSWLALPNTTIRGGFGMYSYNWSLDQYAQKYGVTATGGLLGRSGSITDSTSGRMPVVVLDSSGSSLPYPAPSTDPARFNGQSVGYYVYDTPAPKIYQWNFAVQRQLGQQFMAEIGYVASHGFDLIFPTTYSTVPAADIGPNDGVDRLYPQYSSVTGTRLNAISNYNSLQASITKRLSGGLSFGFGYVWSHFLDDQDSSGWGSHGGAQPYQNPNNTSANYGNSNFDVPQALKGNVTYELPFGKGKMFLNNNLIMDEILGGWQVTGTVLLSSGQPFTVTTNGNTYETPGSSLGGNQYPNRNKSVSTKPDHRSLTEWFNPAAFTMPANGTYGDVQRNSLYGPGINEFNLSGGKTFLLFENMKLNIRADAVNAFNHASFGLPSSTLSATSTMVPGDPYPVGTAGLITSNQVGGRTVQLSAHIDF